MPMDRREFLKRGVVFAAAGGIMPAVFVRAAYATDNNGSASASTNGQKTLVVLQLAGGNDGLNTVVPYSESAYYSQRQGIGIPAANVLKLNERIGLHPAMGGMKKLWDAGKLAVVEGVGYPNPNLSHFRAMQIWHTAAPESERYDGWLGNYLDSTHSESNSLWRAVDVGSSLPLSLVSDQSFVPALDSVGSFAIKTDTKYPKDHANKMDAWASLYANAAAEPGMMAFIGKAGSEAYASSIELQQVAAGYVPAASYPNTALGRALQLAAQIITADLGTGVVYVTTGGFDTHSGQPTGHQQLLTQVSDAIAAFMADVEGHQRSEQVVLMTWSEFGRRVNQNGSNGTDHGTAAPLFVVGSPVKGGAYGEPTPLSNLDRDGNLKYTTDFRRVYATLIEEWLGGDAREAIGGQYAHLGFLGSAAAPPIDLPKERGPYKAFAPGLSR